MSKPKTAFVQSFFPRGYLLCLATLEGAAVMACELIGAKAVAPSISSITHRHVAGCWGER
jgi:hypothetical protein